MLQNTLTLTACLALSALCAMADSNAFQSISRDAASIQKDADAIATDLKTKTFDPTKVRSEIDSLGKDIATLRKDVETLDANLASLTEQQKKEWELVKTKVQLLTIFHDQKTGLLEGDIDRNRSMIRALSLGISKRARMLQDTVARLDK